MIYLNHDKIGKILHMYNPDARYIHEANINLPEFKGVILSPKKQIHLNDSVDIKHLSNVEVTMINSQVTYLLYREAILRGELGVPKIDKEDLKNFYDNMFMKEEHVRYKKFKDRFDCISNNVKAEHKKSKKMNGVYFVWLNVSIEDFCDSEIVAGIKLK